MRESKILEWETQLTPNSDPLFQRCLVDVVRDSSHIFSPSTPVNTRDSKAWSGLPVVFDEVFTGLYRLGRFSSASFLQAQPDISVHAKLLTGGLVPLCTTLASESIYDAFIGNEKRDALLHGHSYTAHPVGCHVANTSLEMLRALELGNSWQIYTNDWTESTRSETSAPQRMAVPTYSSNDIWSAWSKDFVTQISHSRDVESVIALGSVLAISLQDQNAGKTWLCARLCARRIWQ